MRYLLLQVSLAVNPLGRVLLAPHAARWCAARESRCDREAVIHGSLPLPLAQAIVQAARPTACTAVPLGPPAAQLLTLRVELLLAFAEQQPRPAREVGPSPFSAALVLLALALLLPHRAGTVPLDALHAGAERVLTFLWR